jgi:predicted KAP-like P-loop ATPase
MISNKVISSINTKIFQIIGVFLFFILIELFRLNFNIFCKKLNVFSNSQFFLCIFLYIVVILIATNFFMFIFSDRTNKYTTTIFIFFIAICLSYLVGQNHLKSYQGDLFSDLFDNLFYTSVFLIFLYIVVCCSGYFKTNRIKKIGKEDIHYKLFAEKAISTTEEDALGRKGFAEDISSLVSEQSSESLTVGIYGNWGAGKSSLLNLIRAKLEQNKDNIITINFTPWYFESESNDLILRFFEQFLAALNKDRGINTDLKKYLKDYIKLFTAISIRPPGLIINFKEIISNEEKDIYKLKKELEVEFKKTTKKIVVFIDELDRLDNEEIKLIFKLIRLIGDFPNTTYIVGIDEERISKSIGASLNIGNKDINDSEVGLEYIEKFIQIPIYLPRIEQSSIVDFINNKLSITFDEKQLKEINTQLLVDYLVSQDFNLRNIIRYFNLVSFFSNILKDEINLNDLLLLLIIKVKNIKLFNFISKNPDYFTGRVDKKVLEKNKELKKIQDALDQFKPILLQLSIYSAQLFNGEPPRNPSIKGKNRLSHRENFIKYFKYSVPEGVLSVAEIKLFLNQLITLNETIIEEKFKELKKTYSIEDVTNLIAHNMDIIEEHKNGLFTLYKLLMGEYRKNQSNTPVRSIINLMSLCIEKDYDDKYLNVLLKPENIALSFRVKNRISNSDTLNDKEKINFESKVETYFDTYINRELVNNQEITDNDKHMIFREWISKGSRKDIGVVRERITSLLETPSDLEQIIGYFLYAITDEIFADELRVIQYYSRIVDIIEWEKLNHIMYIMKHTENYRNIEFVKKVENRAYEIITENLKSIFENVGHMALETDFDPRYYKEYIMIYNRGNPAITEEWHYYMEM